MSSKSHEEEHTKAKSKKSTHPYDVYTSRYLTVTYFIALLRKRHSLKRRNQIVAKESRIRNLKLPTRIQLQMMQR